MRFPGERYYDGKPTAIQMIDRCTIKFRPALSQKDWRKHAKTMVRPRTMRT